MQKQQQKNPVVFLDVTAGKTPLGRMTFELFADAVPRTAENFRVHCSGERGPQFHYKNVSFHRVIPNFMLQCGDTDHPSGGPQAGTGGKSIYGRTFNDEKFRAKGGNVVGSLSMANSGKNTNGSQFFINMAANSFLDPKHVVFGKLLTGMEIARKIERAGSPSGKTSMRIFISDCGEVKDSASDGAIKDALSGVALPRAPGVQGTPAESKAAAAAKEMQAKKQAEINQKVEAAAKRAAEVVKAGGATQAAPEMKEKLMLERAEQLEEHAAKLVLRAKELRKRAGERREREE